MVKLPDYDLLVTLKNGVIKLKKKAVSLFLLFLPPDLSSSDYKKLYCFIEKRWNWGKDT